MTIPSMGTLLLLLPLAYHAHAALVKNHLHVVNAQLDVDGFDRNATLVDGKFPGTVISGNRGDRFEITVSNELTSEKMYRATSIHWHGIHMRHSTWADGAASITQCPIVPGNSFKYAWDTSEKGSNQAGTFWYHSHFSTQYCDGLRGALIIRDEKDREVYHYDVDNDDTIITLGDWFHFYSSEFKPGPFNYPPFPDTAVINGKGRYPYKPASDIAVITVEPGKRYRMRVIQMACYTNFAYSIDWHTLTIIEADSILTEPYETDEIYVYAGQRYSHILDTRHTEPDAYWIRAQPERLIYTFVNREKTHANYTEPMWGNSTNVAVLRYTNSPNQWPTIPSDINVPIRPRALIEADLKPLHSEPAPGEPGLGKADINLAFDNVANFEEGRFYMNNHSFDTPDVPVMLQIMSGAGKAEDLMPLGSVIKLPRHKVVEIKIRGTTRETGGPHPWHLHGHDFYVIKTPQTDELNYENPLRRDTISSGMEGQEAIIRFTTDNPGPWFLHCHLDWHLEMGMAVVMAEDVPTIAKQKVPEEWHNLCKTYDAWEANAVRPTVQHSSQETNKVMDGFTKRVKRLVGL